MAAFGNAGGGGNGATLGNAGAGATWGASAPTSRPRSKTDVALFLGTGCSHPLIHPSKDLVRQRSIVVRQP